MEIRNWNTIFRCVLTPTWLTLQPHSHFPPSAYGLAVPPPFHSIASPPSLAKNLAPPFTPSLIPKRVKILITKTCRMFTKRVLGVRIWYGWICLTFLDYHLSTIRRSLSSNVVLNGFWRSTVNIFEKHVSGDHEPDSIFLNRFFS